MDLLVGTTNVGKLAEVKAVLKDLPVRTLSLSDLDIRPEIIEDGNTYEENALKKARTLADLSGYATLADDSGLEVDALQGAPGVRSARYGGVEGDDGRNNEKLLRALAAVPREERSARFVCVLALCRPGASAKGGALFRGECEGWITFGPRGQNGFGYDPLFFYAPLGRTFAELDRENKCLVSHRGRALEKLKQAMPAIFGLQTNP